MLFFHSNYSLIQQNCGLYPNVGTIHYETSVSLFQQRLHNAQSISPTKENNIQSNKIANSDYKGMTLKEYFRLSEANPYRHNTEIKQTDEQQSCSSKEAHTPHFNNVVGRQKIKTEVCEQNSFCEDRPPVFISKQKPNPKQNIKNQGKTRYLKINKQQLEMMPLPKCSKNKQKNQNSKRVATLSSYHKQHLNRSTITSFYHIQSKKKRMLDKVKQQKQRINQMKLSDAFFITKYGQKFITRDNNNRKSPF